jgi:hypothetical protein
MTSIWWIPALWVDNNVLSGLYCLRTFRVLQMNWGPFLNCLSLFAGCKPKFLNILWRGKSSLKNLALKMSTTQGPNARTRHLDDIININVCGKKYTVCFGIILLLFERVKSVCVSLCRWSRERLMCRRRWEKTIDTTFTGYPLKKIFNFSSKYGLQLLRGYFVQKSIEPGGTTTRTF